MTALSPIDAFAVLELALTRAMALSQAVDEYPEAQEAVVENIEEAMGEAIAAWAHLARGSDAIPVIRRFIARTYGEDRT